MIDTLKVYVPDYTITGNPSLTLKPAAIDCATGEALGSYTLWMTPDGGKVEGAGAYWNGARMRVDLIPKGDAVRLFVEGSVPKYATGSNVAPVDLATTEAVVRDMQRQLAELGIRANLLDSRLSRLDSFRNVEADEPFPTYAPVLSLLRMKRQQQRSYGTCFLFHNTKQETCIYSKPDEMRHRGLDTTGVPANLMRFEHRLKTGKGIQSALGVKTVRELLTNYDEVARHHLHTMHEELFRYEPAEVEAVTGNDMTAAMLLFQGLYPRTWQSRFISAMGHRELAKAGGVEVIRGAVEMVAGGDEKAVRKRLYRLDRRVREDQATLAMLEPAVGSRTLGDLYRELKGKATAA